MNDHIIEVLIKNIISSLPDDKRQLYEYIIQLEDQVAQNAETSDQFMTALVKCSPHRQAAKQFNCTFSEIITRMREIEYEIDEKLKYKMKNKKWVHCTDIVRRTTTVPPTAHYYLLMI